MLKADFENVGKQIFKSSIVYYGYIPYCNLIKMNDDSELYLQRAENELIAAQILFDVSSSPMSKKEQFKLEKEFTFYSSVISHSYYCIFILLNPYLPVRV